MNAPPYQPVTGSFMIFALALAITGLAYISAGRRTALVTFLVIAGGIAWMSAESRKRLDTEIESNQYAALTERAAFDPNVRKLAVAAMADGRVTQREYRAVYDASQHEAQGDARKALSDQLSEDQDTSL